MTISESTARTQQLLDIALQGDAQARRELLEHHRGHPRRMVAARLDRRLAPRVDASHIVQEALADAAVSLDEYLRHRPMPFFGWLRLLATERLIKTHERHLVARCRSVNRESIPRVFLDDSADRLVNSLIADDTSPSNRLIRKERREHVMLALQDLSTRDRDIRLMRYLEQLATPAIAEAVGMTDWAVKARLFRALIRIRERLQHVS